MKTKGRRPRLAGTVRERGNSRSLVVTLDGKQYSKAVTTQTKKAALAMLPAFIAEVQSGAFDAKREAIRAMQEAPTFTEAAEAFLRDQMRPDADGAATRDAYRHAFKIVARELGDPRISEITKDQLHRTLRKLHQTGRADGKGGLSINTIRLTHAALSRLFGNAVDLGLIPASHIPAFGKLNLGRGEEASERARRSALTGGQVSALIEACHADDALRVWVTVMAATALRPGEAMALRWQDIDLQRSVLNVARSAKRVPGGGRSRLGSTKTPGSVRTMPDLVPGLIAVLASEQARQETTLRRLHGLAENVSPVRPMLGPEDCVFPAGWDDQERRAPMSLDAMRGRFKAAAMRAGLPASTVPHQLRHTVLTRMLAGDGIRPGVGPADAARLAGHSNIATTVRVYAHALAENLQRGMALAGDLITPRASAVVEHLPNAADV